MSDSSRRTFIGVAGAGAAAAGATVLVPGVAAAQTRLHAKSATATVVACVDPDSDEVTLMVGEREVVVNDRDLVHRLLNAAGA